MLRSTWMSTFSSSFSTRYRHNKQVSNKRRRARGIYAMSRQLHWACIRKQQNNHHRQSLVMARLFYRLDCSLMRAPPAHTICDAFASFESNDLEIWTGELTLCRNVCMRSDLDRPLQPRWTTKSYMGRLLESCVEIFPNFYCCCTYLHLVLCSRLLERRDAV
jgi:hypothetical protein